MVCVPTIKTPAVAEVWKWQGGGAALLAAQSKLPASDLFKTGFVALLFYLHPNAGVERVGRRLTALGRRPQSIGDHRIQHLLAGQRAARLGQHLSGRLQRRQGLGGVVG